MSEQNRDDFYEGPELDEQETWHEGAVISEDPDEFEPGPPLSHERSEPLAEVEIPERGAYPLPEVTERPHEVGDSVSPGGSLTRDPSLSRAADRAAAGAPLEDAGYERADEENAG